MNHVTDTLKWPEWPALKQVKSLKKAPFSKRINAWYNGLKLRRKAVMIGDNVDCFGTLVIENQGVLIIGDNTVLQSDFQPNRLAIGKNATLSIGKGCFFNSVIIAAQESIKIGDSCRFGPFVHLMDSDFHDLNDRTLAGKAGEITIGNNVQLGSRVVVLRGVKIGDNAVVLPGAVVTKDVAAGSQVAGVPAKEIEKK